MPVLAELMAQVVALREAHHALNIKVELMAATFASYREQQERRLSELEAQIANFQAIVKMMALAPRALLFVKGRWKEGAIGILLFWDTLSEWLKNWPH